MNNYCLPPHHHFCNSEIILAHGNKRSIPLMNTELLNKVVLLMKGETTEGGISFDASLWDPTQLMISLSLLLVSRRLPIPIIAKPTDPLPMWFVVYNLMYYDKANLLSWHNGDTELPNRLPSDEVQNHWLIRVEAEDRLRANFFQPFGNDREPFNRVRSEWRRLQKYLHLNSRYSQQHTHQQTLSEFEERLEGLLLDCTRAASINYDVQLAAQGLVPIEVPPPGVPANHEFHRINFQERHDQISDDLRIYIGFDIFRRPGRIWIHAEQNQIQQIRTFCSYSTLIRRNLQRYICTLYLVSYPMPVKALKHPRENHHLGDEGLDPFFGEFVPADTYFIDFRRPAPTPRELRLSSIDRPLFLYIYEHIGSLSPKPNSHLPFDNVYPQKLTNARLRRTNDRGTVAVPRPENEALEAGVPPLPPAGLLEWAQIPPLAALFDLGQSSQMTKEEYDWFQAHKRDTIIFVPSGANLPPEEEEEPEEGAPPALPNAGRGGNNGGNNGGNGGGNGGNPPPNNLPPNNPLQRPPAPDGQGGGDRGGRGNGGNPAPGRGGGNPLPRFPQPNIGNLPFVCDESSISLLELFDLKPPADSQPPLRRSPANTYAEDTLSFQKFASASKPQVIIPEEDEAPADDEDTEEFVVVGQEDELEKGNTIVPFLEVTARQTVSVSKKTAIVPEEELGLVTTKSCGAFDEFFTENLDPFATQKSKLSGLGMPKIVNSSTAGTPQNNLHAHRNLFLEGFRRDERNAFLINKHLRPN